MTNEEIVQALRQCAQSDCSSCGMCPIFPDRECVEHLATAAASLIERLTAENAALREKVYSMSGEWCAMMSVWNSMGSYDRLRELAEADKDGRVVVLPCKVGDTVYMIERIFDIDNGVCDEICARAVIGYGGNNLNKLWLVGSGGICNAHIFVSEFGKTVFLTREEAEKTMKGETEK